MSQEQETSPSGSPIYREKALETWEAADHTPYAEAILAHVERYVGPVATVFHEIVSSRVHVDVLVVAPSEERPLWTFVTSGMSARPMALHADAIGLSPSLAEVIIAVAGDWQFSGAGQTLGSSIGDYPISLLRSVARFPHDFETWLGEGHTVGNGDPPAPLSADTAMCGYMLTPVLGKAEFNRLPVEGGAEIAFYGVVPLHEDELQWKLRHGADRLYDLFDSNGVTEVFDPKRPSVAPPPRKPGFLAKIFGR